MKRLLVLSNTPFHPSESNGRTLMRYLQEWETENLAQFYINGNPDNSFCHYYYCVTDRDAVHSFLTRKPVIKSGLEQKTSSVLPEKEATYHRGGKRTPLKLLIREHIWSSQCWWGKDFDSWIKSYQPEILLLYLGNSGFMCDIALKIANQYHIPLFVYTCENYYDKNHDYIKKTFHQGIDYLIYKRRFQQRVKKLFSYADGFIFNTEPLKQLYCKIFPAIQERSNVVMSGSDMVFSHNYEITDHARIVYMGNLGVGRDKPLVKIANALGDIDPGLKLEVYGGIPNEKVKNVLFSCENIQYQGVVSYDEVRKIIRESTLLVHIENFDDYSKLDLKYAFSTKIADSVSSGTPLFCYLPEELICHDFLVETGCAICETDESKLKETLKKALFDLEYRKKTVMKAKETSEIYFNSKKNGQKFLELLTETSNNGL